jgi:hypothetical protein
MTGSWLTIHIRCGHVSDPQGLGSSVVAKAVHLASTLPSETPRHRPDIIPGSDLPARSKLTWVLPSLSCRHRPWQGASRSWWRAIWTPQGLRRCSLVVQSWQGAAPRRITRWSQARDPSDCPKVGRAGGHGDCCPLTSAGTPFCRCVRRITPPSCLPAQPARGRPLQARVVVVPLESVCPHQPQSKPTCIEGVERLTHGPERDSVPYCLCRRPWYLPRRRLCPTSK